jgi:hypothetical protein
MGLGITEKFVIPHPKLKLFYQTTFEMKET